MTSLLTLADDRARADLQTFLRRSSQLGDGSVRFAAVGAAVMATVPLTASTGLMDLGATLLGIRFVRMREQADFDAVVPIDAAIEALAAGADLEIPTAVAIPAWAAITPPRDGWEVVASLSADAVRLGATRAAAAIERQLPASPGEALVRRVRREVWSERLDAHPASVSLGQCVGLDMLGFLTGGVTEVRVTRCGPWSRAATRLGDVVER